MWRAEEREKQFICKVKIHSQGHRAHRWWSRGCVFPVKPALSRSCLGVVPWERKDLAAKSHVTRAKIGSLLSSKWIQVPLSLLSMPIRTESCLGWKIQKTCPSFPPSPHGAACLTSSLSPSALWEVDWPSQLGSPSDFCLALLSSPPRALDSAHPDSESCLAGAQSPSGQSLDCLGGKGE